jgi:CO/xanthine dehydrogenase Mo-binding subunit
MDELARQLGMDPLEFKRMNVVVSGDPMISSHEGEHDVEWGSYGLDQCFDLVETALAAERPHGLSEDWLIGRGIAAGMIDTIPPRGHLAEAKIRLTPEGFYELKVGTAEFGNGTTTVHGQIIASVLATTVDRVRIKQSDTDHVSHDTGAYGSTGTVVAGSATRDAARKLGDIVLDFAARYHDVDRSACVLGQGHVEVDGRPVDLGDLAEAAAAEGLVLEGVGYSGGTPRSVAFNVQAFEIGVHKRYGEIRILRSIHAADAGTVINPMQCRGQVEGGVAQAIGAALYENLMIDAEGRVTNPTFRGYHIPAFADIPRTEVYFADTYDKVGPMGAKSMSESPYNPIAAALGNALRDALGVRLYATPFAADHVYKHVAGPHSEKASA